MSEFKHLLRSSAGIDHYIRYNPDGTVTTASRQDVGAVLADNWENRKENGNLKGKMHKDSVYGTRVAQIPFVVLQQWRQEGFDPFQPGNEAELRRRLNDPDNKALRTNDIRL